MTLNMEVLNKLLSRVLRSADPILLLLLSCWSDFRIHKAKTDADVQLIEDVANAKGQLIKDVTKNMSQMITKIQAGEIKTDSSLIEPDNISNMIEFQIERKVTNLVTIVKYAVKELEGLLDIPNHDPDPAWTNRWVDGAQDVSSEELQKLWGKILAGEIKAPGQTSLRTLSVLRNMTQQEARDFSNLMRFRIENFILDKILGTVLGEYVIPLTIHFSEIGLLGGFGTFPSLTLGDDGTLTVEHCGHALTIEGPPGQQLNRVLTAYNTCLVTVTGGELAKLCQHHEPDRQYLSHLAKLLAEQSCKLKLAKIVSRNAEGYQTCDEQVIEPFVDPEEPNQEEPNNAK